MLSIEKGSFRDPSGQVIISNGKIQRIIYSSYFREYQHMKDFSLLYDELVTLGLLIPHKEIENTRERIVIEPEQIGFISYPYEWCFSMLKEAALKTLEINRIAMKKGMILKDASAYNMQWHKGKMTLIDTLSFAKYDDGMSWIPYRQFIQHFLAPLLIMEHKGSSFGKMALTDLEGTTAVVASEILPAKLRLHASVVAHIYAQRKLANTLAQYNPQIPRMSLEALLANLEALVKSLDYRPKSDWVRYDMGNHDTEASYTLSGSFSKQEIVSSLLRQCEGNNLIDLGANTGEYSWLARQLGFNVIGIDRDADCIEGMNQDYNIIAKKRGEKPILPLVVDLCNPSPAIGWANVERQSFLSRMQVFTDVAMALALIHHICIGNNVPLAKVAELLAEHTKELIIEFVPLEDTKAMILAGRKDFPAYSQEIFEYEFGKWFEIEERREIAESKRSVYLMRKK